MNVVNVIFELGNYTTDMLLYILIRIMGSNIMWYGNNIP